MRHLFTAFCLALVLLLVETEAFAQPTHGITFRENWYNYVTPQPDIDNWQDVFENVDGRGVELAYQRRLGAGNTWLVVPVKLGLAQIAGKEGRSAREGLLGNLDLLLQQNIFKHGSLLNPTIGLGIGSTFNFDRDKFDFNVPASLGLNIKLFENVYLNAQTQYRVSVVTNEFGWQHGIGAVVYFGNEDSDKDGVLNDVDKCPDVAGVAALMGCPDRDGDGVTDLEDKCPEVAGIMSMMGCPDRDSDGITDAEDTCPDVAGIVAFKGCPDTDSDGITDAEDKCPGVAGLAAFMGCPDTDADGITDADDKCPREAGTVANQGCPVRDRDSDGVADKDDVCPDKKGDTAHYGCPDTDGDGVYDNDDRCITVAGPATNRGCPEIKKEDRAKVELAVKAVQFESGKAVLLKQSFKVLDDVATVLQKYPYYSLDMKGHTDSQGEAPMNLDLSKRRAKTCYDYLISKGVKATQITSEGFGETVPIGDNMNAAGRAKNRRVEFDLIVK